MMKIVIIVLIGMALCADRKREFVSDAGEV